MTYNFKGKTAVVTGASRGIGEAIARTLADGGAKVALVARSADKLKALAASLPNGAVAIEADMSSPDGWKAAAEQALKSLGDIDILVNNAGVSAAQAMGKVTPEGLDETLNVNVRNLILLTDALSASLIKRKGNVVNISSVSSFSGALGQIAYSTSKGAVNSMTLYLARALAPEVRVNAVCPGLITSRWFVDGLGQDGFEKVKALTEQSTALGRASTSEDVADAIVWLIDGARTMTGELLLLDAGLHLGTRMQVPGKA